MLSEKSKRVLNIVFWFFIVSTFILCVYIVTFLYQERSECLKNSFTYAAKQVVSDDVQCSCLVNNNGQFSRFSFNSSELWVDDYDGSVFINP